MKKGIVVLLLLFTNFFAKAQHEGHNMPKDSAKKNLNHDMHNMPMDSIPSVHSMSHSFSLNLPMNRNGSGTGWLPDSTPMFGYMVHIKKWMFMFHGNVFFRYNNQDITNKGSRGNKKWDAPNWLMAMGQKKIGKKGLFHFSSMFSLDNVIAGGSGYPLLFQTGETFRGKPLVDRQHPHDLFSELSVSYSQAINSTTDVYVYLGYPGEPALGSVAFMHRVSSLYNPDAPLSHHWNDGTHITFGVATLGVRYGKFKLEGSSFTGREPDENRYDLDKPLFDSYSGRLSFNPNANWALQVSQGFIKSPESIRPEENVDRITASAIYSKPFNHNNFISATALWGLNRSHANENAVLLEGSLVLNRWAIYGRYEWVQKSSDELDLDENIYSHEVSFNVNAITLGFSINTMRSKFLNMAIGVQGTYFSTDSRLNNLYGRNPLSAEVYLRFFPPMKKI
ncbi:MAG: hypothetical protein H0W84_00825 [Bacteroidetes bacterium]|nr:hypothetical protein [Bacteroidota bacterium]